MLVPGSNLLGFAMNVIAPQTIQWNQYLSSTTNAHGRDTKVFAPTVTVKGCSVQPVPRNKYNDLGLDLQKRYVTIFTPAGVADISRDNPGDEIIWNSRKWRTLSASADWMDVDGWQAVIAIDIGASP